MKYLDIVAAVLLVVGGLNWGLFGLFDLDLVAAVGGGREALVAKVIYVVVGIAAVYQAFALRSIQRRWNVAPVAAVAA